MASVMEQNSENLSPEELKENKDRELKKHKEENHNRRPSSGASISSSYSESSSSSESELYEILSTQRKISLCPNVYQKVLLLFF